MPVESVTLHADASFHPDTRESGWGVWIRWGEGRIIRDGKGPDYLEDNNDAEFAAIFAGLHLISIQPWYPELKIIYIRSDSQTALRWLRLPPDVGTHSAVHRMWTKLEEIRKRNLTCEWNIKHVSGHQRSGSGIAAYVNNQVDKASRSARKRKKSGSPD